MRREALRGRRARMGIGLVVVLLAGALVAIVVPAVGQSPSPPSQACEPTKSETLYAVKHPDGLAYGRTPETASIPGPTLELEEGDCLAVKLVNRTGQPTSVHSHGVGYTIASDGTPHSGTCTPDGEERTYVFEAHAPTERADGSIEPGSAGYWNYHDHCGGTAHGTGGIKAGLFGALIVRRPGDPKPDRPPFVLVMIGQTFNLKQAPLTPTFHAIEGERVEFVVIGHGDLFHSFHLHGHRWVNNRTGIPSGPDDDTAVIDNRTVGPADSFGFQVIAGERVGPGRWMYHCHVQEHSDNGMTGFFEVEPRGETLPADPPPEPTQAPAPPDPVPTQSETPPSGPAAEEVAPKATKPAHLRRPQVEVKRARHVRIRGRIAREAVGGIVVTVRARIHAGRRIAIRRRATPKRGRYALSVTLPRRVKRVRHASLTARFVGDPKFAGQTRRQRISARALRASAGAGRPRR